jgi:DNA mismatch repair protein MutS
VERKVVRVVTPGTVTDTELLAERADTLLLALHRASASHLGPGLAGLSSGQLGAHRVQRDANCPAWLARLAPAEMLHDGTRLPPVASRRIARRARAPGLAVRRRAGRAQAVRAAAVATLPASTGAGPGPRRMPPRRRC